MKSYGVEPIRFSSDKQVPTLLQGLEEDLSVNRWMWGSLKEVKGVPNAATIVKPFNNRRKAITLLGNIQHSSKLSNDQKRGRHVEAGILLQPSFHLNSRFQKIAPLLSSTSHRCHNRPTDKKDVRLNFINHLVEFIPSLCCPCVYISLSLIFAI